MVAVSLLIYICPWIYGNYTLAQTQQIGIHTNRNVCRYQPNVRLPALDAKIAACELLLVVFEKMEKRKKFDDCTAIESDLKVLEQTLIQIKYTLVKKLGYLSSSSSASDADSLFDTIIHQSQNTSRYSKNLGSLIIGGGSGNGSSLSGGNRTSQVRK